MRNAFIGQFIFLALATLTACASDDGDSHTNVKNVEPFHTNRICGSEGTNPSITEISNYNQLAEIEKRIHRHLLNYQLQWQNQIEFDTHKLFLLEMGRKPTGGFALTLSDNIITYQDNIIKINVNWRSPNSSAIVAQSITSPCLLVLIPKGSYRKLSVINQSQHEILNIAIR